MLNDALIFFISMSLKFRDEIDFATFDNWMEEDGIVNIKLYIYKVVGILDSLISF